MKKFNIFIDNARTFSNTNDSINLYERFKIGEFKDGNVIYSKFEAFYLFETKKAELIKNNKILTEKEILKLFSKNKDFLMKYLVYKDLKNKGYIIKTGLKFGEEFRVYNKSDYNKHAKWICYPLKDSDRLSLKDFISKIRVSHSTGKKLLLAIVDEEEDILYYETDWIKP
jgi:tRNA-intron endonuclease, archaea type